MPKPCRSLGIVRGPSATRELLCADGTRPGVGECVSPDTSQTPPPTPPAPQPPERNSAYEWAARGTTLAVTNGVKVAGIAGFLHEVFGPTTARDSVLMACVVFVVGADKAESVLLRAIDKLFSPD